MGKAAHLGPPQGRRRELTVAGWGFAIYDKGASEPTHGDRPLLQLCGPVYLDQAHPLHVGATKLSNDAAEISGVIEVTFYTLGAGRANEESHGGDATHALLRTTRSVSIRNRSALWVSPRALSILAGTSSWDNRFAILPTESGSALVCAWNGPGDTMGEGNKSAGNSATKGMNPALGALRLCTWRRGSSWKIGAHPASWTASRTSRT